MASNVKIVVSSKNNLQFKYPNKFAAIETLLNRLAAADKKKGIETMTVFIDDAQSAKKAGIKKVSAITPKDCKKAVDELFKKHMPAYTALLGAQDVFPFQELDNPTGDPDLTIPSDLPYACDAPFGTKVESFVGPTRVVGRIPDIPGRGDFDYLKRVIENSINHKPGKPDGYRKYFSVSAWVWKKSTEESLHNMFGHNGQLQLSPPKTGTYTKTQLKPLTHFYNCHGAPKDQRYFGQKGSSYPEAISSEDLVKRITPGTIAAAECCYGAEMFDPRYDENAAGGNILSISNTYLGNDALAFVGSSTIAYGPAEGQGLADLITQYFIKEIMCGSSAGRAMLESRQEFLDKVGPQLDPYELKTLAQFYLLGDPSVQPVLSDADKSEVSKASIENNRIKLYSKGMGLKRTLTPATKVVDNKKSGDQAKLKKVLKEVGFEDVPQASMFEVKPKKNGKSGMEKAMMGEDARFRTFIKPKYKDFMDRKNHICDIKVLVVKENNENLLGWRLYVSK